MARLSPYPFAALIRRMFREFDRQQAIFDLPGRAFFTGDSTIDFSVDVHGRTASTPFGPAAGPHTQLAQNIVLSWLGGARAIELKTVQVNDHITVPRPCIDVVSVGYNVEWSQELRIEESIEEYVKASMLIEMLVASGRVPVPPSATRTVFDLSVGYDLRGITSDRVGMFIRTMMDARQVVERLRDEIPSDYRAMREVDYSARLTGGVTLSTFHGCPPLEIDRIVEFLLREYGLHVTIKFNPTLLGSRETVRLLHDCLGYREIEVPGGAFESDIAWDQAAEIVGRLRRVATDVGSGLGVKFSNTLLVRNHRQVFRGQPEMYLSGPPLHVLAMHLVRRFRRQFGDTYPVSFSGGIDRTNFPDAVALGLVPVTACTDLLKPRGYARAHEYLRELAARMAAVGATTIDGFVRHAYGLGEGRPLADVTLLNTEHYVAGLESDPRYARERNSRPPRKIGRALQRFDCLSCDKCVPLCPNDANFVFVLPRRGIPVATVRHEGGAWHVTREGSIPVEQAKQFGTFADFCNECGNCDVFCPEDGGPYLVKPRLFGSRAAWAAAPPLDGFWMDRRGDSDTVLARFEGREYRLEVRAGLAAYSGEGFALRFDGSDPEGTMDGRAQAAVDLTLFYIMDALRRSVLSESPVNYVNALH